MKEVTIGEWTAELSQLPWTMTLKRWGRKCYVRIKGGRGGVKASFQIRFKDLAEAVEKLGKEV